MYLAGSVFLGSDPSFSQWSLGLLGTSLLACAMFLGFRV